jgi:hypothetical protein
MKPLSEKVGKGNIWGSQVMNVLKVDPTPTPTPSVTPTSTVTPTPSITPTSTVTPTPSVTPTLTPTQTITPTPSITPTITPTSTLTPTVTPTNTPTPSSSPIPSGTTEANTYLSAVVDAGGTGITPTISAATVTLFTSLVNNGLYSKIIAMYPLLGENAVGCKFNAVNPVDTDAAYRITYAGGMSFNSSGQTSNGSNGLGTTFINQTVEPDLRLMGTYSLSESSTLGQDIINVAETTYMASSYPGGSPKRAIFQFGGGNTAVFNPSDGLGLFIGLFTGTTLGPQLFRNGTLVATRPGVGSTSYGVSNILFPNKTNNTTAFGIFTKELTPSEISTLTTIINTWATTLGRNTF